MLLRLVVLFAFLSLADATCNPPGEEATLRGSWYGFGAAPASHTTRLLGTSTEEDPVLTAIDPKLMRNTVKTGLFARQLKIKAGRLYTMWNSANYYEHDDEGGHGRFRIAVYDLQLNLLQNIDIDMDSVAECARADFVGMCKMSDFDIDSQGNFWIAFKVVNTAQSQLTTATVHKLDANGTSLLSISSPCGVVNLDESAFTFLTTTCSDDVVINCPVQGPVFNIRRYNSVGLPLELTQIPGLTATTMHHFNGQIWFRSLDNHVYGLSLVHWDVLADISIAPDHLEIAREYPQVAVDYSGNVIVTQMYRAEGGSSIAFYMYNGNDVVVRVKFTEFDECTYAAVHCGRLYLMCKEDANEGDRRIIMLDYLS